MKKSTSKQAKVVIVLATYIFKHLQRVCFTVRSSNGRDTYNTCFTNGHGACNCPARPGTCYHITGLAPIAVAKLAERDRKAASYDVVAEAAQVVAEAEAATLDQFYSQCGAEMAPAGIERFFVENRKPAAQTEIVNIPTYRILHRNGRYIPQRAWNGGAFADTGCGPFDAAWEAKQHMAYLYSVEVEVVEEPQMRKSHATCDYCGGNHTSSTCYL